MIRVRLSAWFPVGLANGTWAKTTELDARSLQSPDALGVFDRNPITLEHQSAKCEPGTGRVDSRGNRQAAGGTRGAVASGGVRRLWDCAYPISRRMLPPTLTVHWATEAWRRGERTQHWGGEKNLPVRSAAD
jgi:hypothetical protein